MKAGTETALAAFYDRSAPCLFSMIFAILGNQKESERILQETFSELWKRIASYDPARNTLFTWTVMFARHQAINQLRVRQPAVRLADADAVAIGGNRNLPDQKTAEFAPVEQEDRKRLRFALAQLSDPQRDAIQLAFFSGLRQAQLAERLGAPSGTVKTQIAPGLLLLRDLLKRSASR